MVSKKVVLWPDLDGFNAAAADTELSIVFFRQLGSNIMNRKIKAPTSKTW